MNTNGRRMAISGIRNKSEAGATEEDPVSFITSGKVVIGSTTTSKTHKNQVSLEKAFVITLLVRFSLLWKTKDQQRDGNKQA